MNKSKLFSLVDNYLNLTIKASSLEKLIKKYSQDNLAEYYSEIEKIVNSFGDLDDVKLDEIKLRLEQWGRLGPPDLNALLKILNQVIDRFANNTNHPAYLAAKDFYSRISRALANQNNSQTNSHANNSKTQETASTTQIKNNNPTNTVGYKSIDPYFQILLGVNGDGKWGPLTQKALDKYKLEHNLSNDQQALNELSKAKETARALIGG